jgi:acyl phosphate:glycerol-3-phosphate acyltransferase
MIVVKYALVLVASYLLGAIPWGYVVGRLYGVDVRKHGSGKTGGTNLARLVGWTRTIPVAIADPGKAVVAVLVARAVLQNEWGAVMAALAAVAGHNWPIYLGFKGGRGVGPVFGAMLVFNPLIALVAGGCGVLVAVTSRYVSLGSITGSALAIILTVAAYLMSAERVEHVVAAVIACGLIIVLHHDNIQRLLAGTERRLGQYITAKPEQEK